jgi:hypothetical protein
MAPHRYDDSFEEEEGAAPSDLLDFVLREHASNPIATLRAVGQLQTLLSDIEDVAVLQARAEDISWSKIAEAVGRSKQAVWEKHRPDGNPWVDRKRVRLTDIGALLDRLRPLAYRQGLTPEDQHVEEWRSGVNLLRRALTAFSSEELSFCRDLAREGARRVDERSMLDQATAEVQAALESLQPLILTPEDLKSLRSPRVVVE